MVVAGIDQRCQLLQKTSGCTAVHRYTQKSSAMKKSDVKVRKKKITTLIILAILAVLLFWAGNAVVLYLSIPRYDTYWKNRTKESGSLTYVALGDSAAQGIGASKPENGYVGLIARQLEQKTGKTVRVVNVSRTGAKIQDVLDRQLNLVRDIKADVVTIEIGANDINNFDDVSFKAQFELVASRLPKGTYVSNMPYFGSRPASRQNAFQASEIIHTVLAKHQQLIPVDLQTITQSRNSIRGYAADYFHPNNRAYKNWAEAFWKEINKKQR